MFEESLIIDTALAAINSRAGADARVAAEVAFAEGLALSDTLGLLANQFQGVTSLANILISLRDQA